MWFHGWPLVPPVTFDVALVQKTQPKSPGLLRIGQPDPQSGNLFGLCSTQKVRQATAMLNPRRSTAIAAISRR